MTDILYPENLFFEGGGAKGVAYLGALEILEDQGILGAVKRFGGTSIGALVALIAALGYSVKERFSLFMDKIKGESLKDDSFLTVMNMERLLTQSHYYKGEAMKNAIADIIKQKTDDIDITFEDLKSKGKDLSTVTTILGQGGGIKVFSYYTSPKVKVLDAVLASMSFPYAFPPVQIDNQFYVDGGISGNYAISIYDAPPFCTGHYNHLTWGLRIDNSDEIDPSQKLRDPLLAPINFFSFSRLIVETFLGVNENIYNMEEKKRGRSITIDCGDTQTFDFEMSQDAKMKLIESGRKATQSFLKERGFLK